jgi:hypothetical protein
VMVGKDFASGGGLRWLSGIDAPDKSLKEE